MTAREIASVSLSEDLDDLQNTNSLLRKDSLTLQHYSLPITTVHGLTCHSTISPFKT